MSLGPFEDVEERQDLPATSGNQPLKPKPESKNDEADSAVKEAAKDAACALMCTWEAQRVRRNALDEAVKMYHKAVAVNREDDVTSGCPISDDHIGAVLQLAGSLVVAAETTRLADITYELGRDQAKLLERIAASL